MFNPYSASGMIRAEKRRCPICDTRKMSYREDGRVMCKYGHEQAGIIEESTEAVVDGVTRRHILKTKRMSKKQLARSRRLYGNKALFAILQAMQYIIKLQATTLVRDLGAPEALIGAVRNIWLLYVGQLDDIDMLDLGADGELNETQPASEAGTANQSRSHSIFTADSLFAQQLSQPQYPNYLDDSLDALLQKVDDDIARDEQEMLEWQQENDQQVQDDQDELQAQDDSNFLSTSEAVEAAASRQLSTDSQPIHRSSNVLIVKEIKKFVRMEYLPAILYLAFLQIQAPIMFADMYYILAQERIPYASAYLRIPEDIYSRLGRGIAPIFMVPYALSVPRLRSLVGAFERLFSETLSITFPRPDMPIRMLSLLKRLGLPIELYSMAMRAIELAGDRMYSQIRRMQDASVTAMAAIVVCLKLHYGLDEIERKPSNTDPEVCLQLPPLSEFLEAWRDGWESELTIGAVPFLTAYSEHWQREFAEYYRRLVSRKQISWYRSVYRDIARRYRQAIDYLAASEQMCAETAQKMLPYEYVRRFQAQAENANTSTETDAMQTEEDSTAAELMKRIEPVRMAAVYSSSADEVKRSHRRAFATIFEPFTNHPEIQLEPGELHALPYIQFNHNVFGGGYTIPIFGLIAGRCAMMLGCAPEELIRYVTAFEHRLYIGTTGNLPFR
ncbi:hypothetical protein BX070DRAFT_233359 [Coemansia spiralis]|nr:hypothetical protein BX070DRAFT_233359 [Coemansia spiralis]